MAFQLIYVCLKVIAECYNYKKKTCLTQSPALHLETLFLKLVVIAVELVSIRFIPIVFTYNGTITCVLLNKTNKHRSDISQNKKIQKELGETKYETDSQ